MTLTRRALAALVVLASVGAAACGGSDPEDLGPPMVEIGEGDVEFVPMTDGQDAYIIQGPQGGYHLLGSVRTSGLVPGDPDDLSFPDNPTTDFRILRGGTRVDNTQATEYVQGLDDAPGGGHQMIGRFVILDILDDAELDGADVVFEVQVTDHRGVTATDRRNLHLVPHPANL